MRQTIIIVTIATKQKAVQRSGTSRTSWRSWRVWWALLPLLLPKLLVCNIGLPGNSLLQRMCWQWQSVWESDWFRLHKCFRFKFAQTNSRVTEQKFGFHKQQQQQKIASTSNHRRAADNWSRLCWTPAKSRSCIVFLLTKEYFIQLKKLIVISIDFNLILWCKFYVLFHSQT